jgi:REP element-mobilizing transposase RayT
VNNHFDPDKHHRHSIRLRGWDYTNPGAYFITICTYQRANLFEDEHLRILAENGWRNIPSQPHTRQVVLDEWIVMPNHLHGILILTRTEEEETINENKATLNSAFGLNQDNDAADPLITFPPVSPLPFDLSPTQPHGVAPGSIGAIVGNFKSLVTRRVNNLRRTPGQKLWQRGYYERIVRNERELNAIRQYIQDNPRRWAEDRENLDVLVAKMRLVL